MLSGKVQEAIRNHLMHCDFETQVDHVTRKYQFLCVFNDLVITVSKRANIKQGTCYELRIHHAKTNTTYSHTNSERVQLGCTFKASGFVCDFWQILRERQEIRTHEVNREIQQHIEKLIGV